MITLSQDEVTAFNIISSNLNVLQQQLNQGQSAQIAVIRLLEIKYHATFDEKTGKFEETKTG